MRAYWNTGAIWHRGDKGDTEMEKQVYNWYHYTWLCGDHIVEQHLHNIDVCNWFKGGHPVEVVASGGAGKPSHLVDAFTQGKADAAIIAGMIHTGKYTIPRIKQELIAAGIPIRRKW